MRKWLIYTISSCEALGSLQIDITPHTKLACARYWLWILEIIKYRRVKNLIVSREAIPSKILVTIEHSSYFTTTL